MPENKASAVASWLGYVTQEYRLVQRLLKADKKSILGFELLDDVEEKSDKGRIVEQDKVSVTTRNIVANQSKALWNTLSNWINLIKEDKVDSSETTFVLFTNKEHTSEVLKLLVKASNKSEAQEAYNEIIKYVHSPSDNIKQYVDNFLVMDERKYDLIENFQYIFGSGSAPDDLKSTYLSIVTSVTEKSEDILSEILGWTKNVLVDLAEKREPTLIAASAFGNRLGEIESKYRQKSILDFVCQRAADDSEVTSELSNNPLYIRQLEIIDADTTEIEEAVISKLEAKDAVSTWTIEGHIQESSYQKYNDALTRKWHQQKGITYLQNKQLNDEEKGQLLYLECQRESESIRLNEKSVDDFFSRGSFQELANSKMVGWHPNYKHKLKESSNDT